MLHDSQTLGAVVGLATVPGSTTVWALCAAASPSLVQLVVATGVIQSTIEVATLVPNVQLPPLPVLYAVTWTDGYHGLLLPVAMAGDAQSPHGAILALAVQPPRASSTALRAQAETDAVADAAASAVPRVIWTTPWMPLPAMPRIKPTLGLLQSLLVWATGLEVVAFSFATPAWL